MRKQPRVTIHLRNVYEIRTADGDVIGSHFESARRTTSNWSFVDDNSAITVKTDFHSTVFSHIPVSGVIEDMSEDLEERVQQIRCGGCLNEE